jgi:hypothetical protein
MDLSHPHSIFLAAAMTSQANSSVPDTAKARHLTALQAMQKPPTGWHPSIRAEAGIPAA